MSLSLSFASLHSPSSMPGGGGLRCLRRFATVSSISTNLVAEMSSRAMLCKITCSIAAFCTTVTSTPDGASECRGRSMPDNRLVSTCFRKTQSTSPRIQEKHYLQLSTSLSFLQHRCPISSKPYRSTATRFSHSKSSTFSRQAFVARPPRHRTTSQQR